MVQTCRASSTLMGAIVENQLITNSYQSHQQWMNDGILYTV